MNEFRWLAYFKLWAGSRKSVWKIYFPLIISTPPFCSAGQYPVVDVLLASQLQFQSPAVGAGDGSALWKPWIIYPSTWPLDIESWPLLLLLSLLFEIQFLIQGLCQWFAIFTRLAPRSVSRAWNLEGGPPSAAPQVVPSYVPMQYMVLRVSNIFLWSLLFFW
jgi:hypothetical protein